MHTTQHPSRPRPPRRSRRARTTSLSASFVAVILLAFGWAGTGAAGASEFTPDPAATAAASCSAANFGTDITVTMTNTAGLDAAHFTVDSFAYGPTSHVVAAGDSEVFVIDGVPESVHLELTVTADYGVVLTQSFDTDCYGYTGLLTPRCDGADAFLDLHVERTGELAGNVYIDVDGQTVDGSWVDGTWDRSIAVSSGVPLDVVVGNNHDGLIAQHSAPIDCAAPTTTSTLPIPPTTVPPVVLDVTTVAPLDPEPVAQVEGAVIVDDTAPDELAFTGGETGLLATIGVLLLAAGVTSHTVGRRRRRIGA